MLFSDPTGSGIESGIQVLVQGAAEVDDRDLAANRERYERESAAKLGGARAVRFPRILHGVLGWYVQSHLHQGPPRAGVRLARRRGHAAARGPRLAPGGGPLRAQRGAAGGARASHGRRRGLGRADRGSWVAATRPRCSPGWPRMASRSRVRLPVSLDCRRPPDPPRRRAGGPAPGRGPRLPDGPQPQPRLQLARELPGPRRPRPGRRGLGARAAQARRRPRAPEQGPAGPVPGQHGAGRSASTERHGTKKR